MLHFPIPNPCVGPQKEEAKYNAITHAKTDIFPMHKFVFVLVILTLISSIAVIHTKHQIRMEISKQALLHKELDATTADWKYLQLEKSAFLLRNRIEVIATKDFRMEQPPWVVSIVLE